MTRVFTIAAVSLSALALAACGSSNKSTTTKSAPASTAVASTPTSTSAASTPTTSSTPTGTSTSSTSTAASGGSSITAFRSALIAERNAGKPLGPALVKAIQNAGSMSNATFAATFGALGTQFAQYATSIGKIQAPPQYKAQLAAVQSGFAALARDITSLSQSQTAAQSRARTQQLVKDIHTLQASEKTLDKAVGIPRG